LKNNLIILKIGGSVLTDKTKPLSVNTDVIESIATQIASIKLPNLIIVHGGGSFGHPLAEKYRLVNGIKESNQIFGITKTHQAMLNLNKIIVEIFISHNIPIIPISPLDVFFTNNGRIEESFLLPIKKSLEIGLIPMLFGDTVYDFSQGVSILSGDQIVAFLSEKLNANKLILGTDIDGLFTADPKIYTNAKLIREVTPENFPEIKANLSRETSKKQIDVTGGMLGKLNELITVAKTGVTIYIINAKIDNNIKKIILGAEDIGTKFVGWCNES